MLDFVVNFVQVLDKNDASEVITDKEPCKGLISKLIEKLESPELRKIIKDTRERGFNDEKRNLTFF